MYYILKKKSKKGSKVWIHTMIDDIVFFIIIGAFIKKLSFLRPDMDQMLSNCFQKKWKPFLVFFEPYVVVYGSNICCKFPIKVLWNATRKVQTQIRIQTTWNINCSCLFFCWGELTHDNSPKDKSFQIMWRGENASKFSSTYYTLCVNFFPTFARFKIFTHISQFL